ncbi:MAG TPA: InlB B-repeat-containing protein [Candidatus Bathyarchaeia archaeon]|nr:InlB B-repeat-containing protein [Candidatus Bathyarchaeia archaeon]
MRERGSIVLFFVAGLLLLLAPLMVSFATSSQCQLTINSAIGGTTVPPPRIYTYAYGANVTIDAMPASGHIFDYWTDGSGHFTEGANPIMQTLYSNVTLQPFFENMSTAKRVLTIRAAANGSTNPSAGNYTYSYGANVTITATPNSGYIFDFWVGQNGNFMGYANPMMINIDYNATLQPVFENASTATRTLTINASSGGTTSPPPGNYTYPYMTNLAITAIPNSGYVFDHWVMNSGGNSGNQNPTQFTINWNTTIQPIFENATSGPRTLTIFSPSNGTTSPTPGTYNYSYGENVSITAIPQNGAYFGGWFLDQASAGMSNPITITMDSSHTLMANFTPKPPSTVQVTISPATGGTTNPAPGTYTYPAGNQARVTAIPNSGWWLSYWLLDGNKSGNSTTIEFNLNGNHTVRPVFASNSHSASYMLAINAADGGTTNPASGTYTYNYGANVTVTATPESGQSFDYWLLDGQTEKENPVTLQMTQDHTLQPVFTSSQGNSGPGHGLSFNIPSLFILVPGMVAIACCFVGYLVPLGLAVRKGKIPPSVKKPRLFLALVSIFIIVGPLGATLLAYRGNLSGVLTPSNTNKITNTLFSQGGIGMPNITSAWYNLTSRELCLLFNFSNPTATNLTLIAYSANLTDHSDGYPLGWVRLANPVTAAANETVTFQMTTMLGEEAAGHIATAYAGTSSFEVDLSRENLNYAGLMLHLNGTSTVNDVSIWS